MSLITCPVRLPIWDFNHTFSIVVWHRIPATAYPALAHISPVFLVMTKFLCSFEIQRGLKFSG